MRKSNKHLTEWHPYYVWFPCCFDKVGSAESCWVWLEWIGRKLVDGNFYSYYIYDLDFCKKENGND